MRRFDVSHAQMCFHHSYTSLHVGVESKVGPCHVYVLKAKGGMELLSSSGNQYMAWWKRAVGGKASFGIILTTTGMLSHMEGSSTGVPGLGRGCWWRWEELQPEWGWQWWNLSSKCLLSDGAGICICCWACWVSGITYQYRWWLFHHFAFAVFLIYL